MRSIKDASVIKMNVFWRGGAGELNTGFNKY